ncbi:MAG: T9SS type A sorting domain-containing protein [Candidatus Fermentibacteria bacterium]
MMISRCITFPASLATVFLLLFSVTDACAQPDTLWTQTYGGSESDLCYDLLQTADGGFILAGNTYSYGTGLSDVYLVKTDSLGEQEWFQTYGYSGTSSSDGGHSVQQTADGGYIITGDTSGSGLYDLYLIKTDSSGNELWSKTYGGPIFEGGKSVQQTIDGGYIISGYTNSSGAGMDDIWLIRTDASGNLLWDKVIGGSGYDMGNCVLTTTDGGILLLGSLFSPGNNKDVYLCRLDSSGTELWSRTYGGTEADEGLCMLQKADGNIVIAGWTRSSGAGYADAYLIETDSSGTELWSQTYGGDGYDFAYDIHQTFDGGYIIGGESSPDGVPSDMYILRTDSSGTELWSQTYGGSMDDMGRGILQTANGQYLLAGTTSAFGQGLNDMWLICLESDITGIEEPDLLLEPVQTLLPAFPNPFSASTTFSFHLEDIRHVEVAVFDLQGRQVKQLTCHVYGPGAHTLLWNGTDSSGRGASRGIYFLRMVAGGIVSQQRIILIR